MKKIIYLSLVAFLIILGSSAIDNVSGVNPGVSQLNSATPDPTISFRSQGFFWFPLICDGVIVNQLFGVVDLHVVAFGYPNTSQYTMRASGTLTDWFGEEFRIMEVEKIDGPEFSFHFNIIGDKGSHYILFGSGTFYPWSITFEKAVCPNGPMEKE